MISFRPMAKCDIGDVLLIERQCFAVPMPRDIIRRCLSSCRCVVVAEGKKIIGHGIFFNDSGVIRVSTLCVVRDRRRQGIGSSIVDMAVSFCRSVQASTVSVGVHERNLDAQLFLRSLGFRAIKTVTIANEEDVYVMEYAIDPKRRHPCQACRGTGVVQAGKAIRLNGRMQSKDVPCQACRGTGTAKYFTKG